MGIQVFKNLNNIIFGKGCENPEHQAQMKFVSKPEKAIQLQSSPCFDRVVYHQDNFSIINMKHEELKFDKPNYLGATVTELAKFHMYRFYYGAVLPYFGRENIDLLMTDTDSLMLKIRTSNADEFFEKEIPLFNQACSNMVEHPAAGNIGKIGVFKSEMGTDPIVSFVGLRVKMYLYVTASEVEAHNKAKGITKDVAAAFAHDDYKQALRDGSGALVTMRAIRSVQHQLYTVEMQKKGLTCNDVKRWIAPDGIHTYPYGCDDMTGEQYGMLEDFL